MNECKVEICNATTCKYNHKKKCQLEKVTIGSDAKCQQYDSDAPSTITDPYPVHPNEPKRWKEALKPTEYRNPFTPLEQ